jgi:hypothetical protein
MKISTFHNNLSFILENEEVLTDPSLYLGNNWKSILNFWFYLENLSEHIKQKILEFDKEEYHNAGIIKYVDYIYHILPPEEDYIWDAVNMNCEEISLNWYYAWATLEILCHDKILKNNLELKFLPLFIPPKPKIVLVSTPKGEMTMDYMKSIVNKFYPNLFGDLPGVEPISSQMSSEYLDISRNEMPILEQIRTGRTIF